MSSDSERRYEDIMRQIAARKPFGKPRRDARPPTPHDRALNLVNAYDSLRQLSERRYARILCQGPKTLRGAAWSAVVIWYRVKGYHGYQRLNVLGIWARYVDGEMALCVGIRKLEYKAPIFDASVYRVAMENGFHLYYEDDGHPPDEGDEVMYQAAFDAEQRLRHRLAIRDALAKWLREIEGD